MSEFMKFWSLGGDATLNLTTSGGTVKVEFNCTLGQPGAPYSFPPSSAPPFAPFLTDPATVVHPKGKETALELPATRQLRMKKLLQYPQLQPQPLLIQRQTSPPLNQWLQKWSQLLVSLQKKLILIQNHFLAFSVTNVAKLIVVRKDWGSTRG